MDTRRTVKTITIVICITAFAGIHMACNNGQIMMHDGRWTAFIANLNWVQIIISSGIGFLLGFFVCKRKK